MERLSTSEQDASTRLVRGAGRTYLPRLTTKVFWDLAIWMTGFGVVMGLAFPYFSVALGVPAPNVLTPKYFGATLAAGITVGWVNYSLAKGVVGSRLELMRARMLAIESAVRQASHEEVDLSAEMTALAVAVDSNDAIGASALSFNRLVDALAESQETGQNVQEISRMLASFEQMDPLASHGLVAVQRAVGAEAAALCVIRDGSLQTAYSIGMLDAPLLAHRDQVQACVLAGQSALLEFPDDLIMDGAIVSFRPRSAYFAPLYAHDEVVGVLILASSTSFSASELTTVERVLPSFGIAVSQALAYERLQVIASTDPLTGLANRRFGMEKLREHFEQAVGAGEPLGLLLLDLDHFKQINDNSGHQIGDLVLRAVAREVAEVLREGDLMIRYGGEEFLVVLPGARRDVVQRVGERIRVTVGNTVVPNSQGNVSVTVSIGAASFPLVNAHNMQELIMAADNAMYQSKHDGRDRLTMATSIDTPDSFVIDGQLSAAT